MKRLVGVDVLSETFVSLLQIPLDLVAFHHSTWLLCAFLVLLQMEFSPLFFILFIVFSWL